VKEKQNKTPQEKKALSYKKDRHTFAWHSDKGLRKARPKRKATANQQFRRLADVTLHGLLKTAEPGSEDTCVTNERLSSGVTRKRLRKIDSVPLPEAIAVKQMRRRAREGRKARMHERQIKEAKTVVSFFMRLTKQEALTLVEINELRPSDFAKFLRLDKPNPELVRAALWFRDWTHSVESARELLGFDKEWLKKLNECVKKVDRIRGEIERGRQWNIVQESVRSA
jgi:hypothetical protein